MDDIHEEIKSLLKAVNDLLRNIDKSNQILKKMLSRFSEDLLYYLVRFENSSDGEIMKKEILDPLHEQPEEGSMDMIDVVDPHEEDHEFLDPLHVRSEDGEILKLSTNSAKINLKRLFEPQDITYGEMGKILGSHVESSQDAEVDLNVEEFVLCQDCGLSFKSRAALRKHKTDVHKVSLSVCNVCGKSCNNQKGLRNHMRSHDKKTCGICGKKISPSYFKQHRQACSMQPPETFGKNKTAAFNDVNVTKSEDGSTEIIDVVDPYEDDSNFTDTNDLKDDIETLDSEIEETQNDEMNLASNTYLEVDKNEELLHNETNTSEVVRINLNQFNIQKEDEVFKCPKCSQIFSRKQNMNKHFKTCINEGKNDSGKGSI